MQIHQPAMFTRSPRARAIKRPELDTEARDSFSVFAGPRSRAFTLVEMLVAVALVVLMMTLFATIFQMATGAMATQKGTSENDQRVRLVLNLLRNDLNGDMYDRSDSTKPKAYRTFRKLIPYGVWTNPSGTVIGEDGQSGFDATGRDGYFYIAENNPDDDTDDVLAFTVALPESSVERFFGRATALADGNGSFGPGNPIPGTQLQNGQAYYSNQPEMDDSVPFITQPSIAAAVTNRTGSSTVAEICYFLRQGTLYRRVMLIRKPNVFPAPSDGTPTTYVSTYPSSTVTGSGSDAQPLNMAAYGPNPPNIVLNFWTDYDYAALFDSRTGSGLRFHSTGTQQDSLSWQGSSDFPNPFSLGNPAYRFGHDSTWVTVNGNKVPGASYGLPREYVNGSFIGRFTHRETSDPNFGYPGRANNNPLAQGTTLTYDSQVDSRTRGFVTSFPNGVRLAEDMLMTNVQKFDIKVWDPGASFGPDGAPGVAGIDDDGDGNVDVIPGNPATPDTKELGWPGSDDGDFRDIGHPGTFGFYRQSVAYVLPGYSAIQPANGTPAKNMLQRVVNTASYYGANGTNGPANFGANRFDTWNPQLDLLNQSATNLSNGTTTNPTPYRDPPPYRPAFKGLDQKYGKAGVDDDRDGTVDNITELGWPGSDDLIPLSAIQIKISFYDRTSDQLREVTLAQSLLYQP